MQCLPCVLIFWRNLIYKLFSTSWNSFHDILFTYKLNIWTVNTPILMHIIHLEFKVTFYLKFQVNFFMYRLFASQLEPSFVLTPLSGLAKSAIYNKCILSTISSEVVYLPAAPWLFCRTVIFPLQWVHSNALWSLNSNEYIVISMRTWRTVIF